MGARAAFRSVDRTSDAGPSAHDTDDRDEKRCEEERRDSQGKPRVGFGDDRLSRRQCEEHRTGNDAHEWQDHPPQQPMDDRGLCVAIEGSWKCHAKA